MECFVNDKPAVKVLCVNYVCLWYETALYT